MSASAEERGSRETIENLAREVARKVRKGRGGPTKKGGRAEGGVRPLGSTTTQETLHREKLGSALSRIVAEKPPLGERLLLPPISLALGGTAATRAKSERGKVHQPRSINQKTAASLPTREADKRPYYNQHYKGSHIQGVQEGGAQTGDLINVRL